ncbi:TPMT family class I SAM-dependent methyltransferase [Massilia solisilvae]|uniref:TPMT family class I SAM-dependent methyltransferase n=1 Tax=Massilia solisilvae TaxID=1811225 RepID=A0ABT2BQC4_9BURK|nr:TPMT family class I SAM-dependent methyltransferase [Massilia solisilvae]
MSTPSFDTRDPKSAAFWDERFARGFTPWDRAGVPEALRRFVAASPRPLATLIPGCGSAYELAYLSEAGWDAIAIDFSAAAVASAMTVAGKWAERVVQADFFTYVPPRPLDLIYERAFFCSMPREMLPRLAERWAQLLPAGGMLAGYFYFDDAPKGPPFGTSRAKLDELLTPYFECIADEAVTDSIPIFQNKERWMVWRRLPA